MKDFLSPKSNYVNSIGKFYNQEVELVKKLNFFNPEECNVKSLFSPKLNKEMPLKMSNLGRRKRSMDDVRVSNYKKSPVISQGHSRRISSVIVLPEIITDLNHRLQEIENKNILSKNMSVKRIENLANENRLESERSQLEEQITALKNEKLKNINLLLTTQKQIQSMEVEFNILSKEIKCGNDSTPSPRKIEVNKSFRRSANTKNFDIIHKVMSQFQKEMDFKERTFNQLKVKIESQIMNKKNLREIISENKLKLNSLNKKLDVVKNQLMLHYHLLLNDGTDTRHEGLVWIIKAIWNLGCDVIISYLPIFLDEKAIQYLFTLAQKDIELQKLKNSIDETKLKMKSSLKEKREKRSLISVEFFKTEMKVRIKNLKISYITFLGSKSHH
jgi:hypothetical protein